MTICALLGMAFVMQKYLLRRFLALLPKLLIFSLIVFAALEFMPGDAITRTISYETLKKMKPDAIEEMREMLGLNDPAPVRYLRWLGNVLQGDLGYSHVNQNSISQSLANRLPPTLLLCAVAVIPASLLGLIMGIIAALRRNTIIDYLVSALGTVGITLPDFFTAVSFIIIFAINLGLFPTGGQVAYGRESFADRLHFLTLPAMALGFGFICTLLRVTRGAMLGVLEKEYIKTARSKGISETAVTFRHALRNSLIPIIPTLVYRIPILVGGSLIIEKIFNYSGMGSLYVSASTSNDTPTIMMIMLIMGSVMLFCSFLLDVLTGILDPRVRL